MLTKRVLLKNYTDFVDFPVTIITGGNYIHLHSLMGIAGVPYIYTMDNFSYDKIKQLSNKYSVFICKNTVDSNDILSHSNMLFISTVDIIKANNFLFIEKVSEDTPQELAKFIGIEGFRAIRYDKIRQIWFNFGKVQPKKSHSKTALLSRYTKEIMGWIAAGRPVRSPEVIKKIYDEFCSKCPEFILKDKEQGICNLCGCNIKRENGKGGALLNKLAIATAECAYPDEDKKRFLAITTISEKDVENRKQELYSKYIDEIRKTNSGGCNCGKK